MNLLSLISMRNLHALCPSTTLCVDSTLESRRVVKRLFSAEQASEYLLDIAIRGQLNSTSSNEPPGSFFHWAKYPSFSLMDASFYTLSFPWEEPSDSEYGWTSF